MINIICGILIVILIIVIIFCMTKNNTEEDFGSVNGTKILFFDSPRCGFSAKMRKQLEAEHMKIGNVHVKPIDITTKDGNALMVKSGIDGTPGFLNTSNGKTTSGLQSIEKLRETLIGNSKENFGDTKNIQFITRPGCGFATASQNLLEKANWKINGITVDKVDINSSLGKELATKMNINGTPGFVYGDKLVMGHRENLDLVSQELFNSKEEFGESKEEFGLEKLTVIGSSGCPFCINNIKY